MDLKTKQKIEILSEGVKEIKDVLTKLVDKLCIDEVNCDTCEGWGYITSRTKGNIECPTCHSMP